MCHFETTLFSGCGCNKRKADVGLAICIVAEVYGRECAASQCETHPERQTECFGLVCMDCVEDKSGGTDKEKKTRKVWGRK